MKRIYGFILFLLVSIAIPTISPHPTNAEGCNFILNTRSASFLGVYLNSVTNGNSYTVTVTSPVDNSVLYISPPQTADGQKDVGQNSDVSFNIPLDQNIIEAITEQNISISESAPAGNATSCTGGFNTNPLTDVINIEITNPDDPRKINGNTLPVEFKVTGLLPVTPYSFCPDSRILEGICAADEYDLPLTSDANGDILGIMCPDGVFGDNTIVSIKGIDDTCDSGAYFQTGMKYAIAIAKKNDEPFDVEHVAKIAEVYINYLVPKTILSPNLEAGYDDEFQTVVKNNGKVIFDPAHGLSKTIDVPINNPPEISLTGLLYNANNDKRNNYQIAVKGTSNDYSEEKCVAIKESSKSGDQGISEKAIFFLEGDDADSGNPLQPGYYEITIKEQRNEKSGISGVFKRDSCQGGAPLYSLQFAVINENGKANAYINTRDILFDPNGYFKSEGKKYGNLPPPCATSLDEKGNCSAIKTALGQFPTDPAKFVQALFSWGLYIISFVVVLYSIYAGYLLISSQGDKEKVAHAREVITSIIIGLIFIVLSFAILAIIGVDIIRIPGFSRQ